MSICTTTCLLINSVHLHYPLYMSIHQTINVCNNLDLLIPIGCLTFYVPSHPDCAFVAQPVQGTLWKWLDASFLNEIYGPALHPIAKALITLIRHRYLVSTFKSYRLEQKYPILTRARLSKPSPPLCLWVVRVYAVQLDISGATGLRKFRSSLLSSPQRIFTSNWFLLVNHMDFSPQTWTNGDLQLMALLPLVSPELSDRSAVNRSQSSFHTGRWFRQESFSRETDRQESLESVVRRVYSQVSCSSLYGVSVESGMEISGKNGLEKGISEPGVNPSLQLLIETLQKHSQGTQCIPGLSSTLFPYQLSAICRMYEKEISEVKEPVPNFVPLTSPTGKLYYYDTLSPGIYSRPEMYALPKGGILAENMGLGKTLICLALVSLTRHEVSEIPEDQFIGNEWDSNEKIQRIQRDSSQRGSSQRGSIQKLQTDVQKNSTPPAPMALPKSLVQISTSTISENSLPWKLYLEDLPQTVIETLSRSPGTFLVFLKSPKRTARDKTQGPSHRSLYLCTTTLIVVPENLLPQWSEEYNKHLESTRLKRLYISDRFKNPFFDSGAEYTNVLPDAVRLTTYDMVVITSAKFSKLFLVQPSNAFTEIYWKRLIIDEGHSVNSKSSVISTNCALLHVERRWAVTGTPTAGLTDLHMENFEESANWDSVKSRKKRKYVVKSTFNVRDDLSKLGNLVSIYFRIEPFHSGPKLWNSAIIKSLDGSNKVPAEKALSRLLSTLMVRHSQGQIDEAVKLPQLHHEAVFLAPSFHNKLAINLFTAVLAVNAVSSERVGPDYMFAVENRLQLRRLVNNLQIATFYWTGFLYNDVNNLIKIIQHCLAKRNGRGEPFYSPADEQLLHDSNKAAMQAILNFRWRSSSLLHEMNYFTKDLPIQFTREFSVGILDGQGIFGAPHLAAVQEFFFKNRFLQLFDDAKAQERLKEASLKFWENYWNSSGKHGRENIDPKDFYALKAEKGFEERKVSEEGEKGEFLNQKKDFRTNEVRFKGNVEDFDLKSEDFVSSEKVFENGEIFVEKGEDFVEKGEDFVEKDVNLQPESMNSSSESPKFSKKPKSPLPPKDALILGTALAKLSYLASKLVQNKKQKIKSIVFFDHEDNAYYLSEFLDILGVPYILYATFIGAESRSNNLNAFASHNSNDGGLVLIMDLKLASHGLTIISATRVYFMSPVWQQSVEAQAIKRAHRIGQTKEVFVETLVLKGTLEEEIYKRREHGEISRNPPSVDLEFADNSRKYVIDDLRMQTFILKHLFLDINRLEEEFSPFIVEESAKSLELISEDPMEQCHERKGQLDLMEKVQTLETLENPKIPTSSNRLNSANPNMEDFSLGSHVEEKIDKFHSKWRMKLFTEDRLQSLTDLKRQNSDAEQLNFELVHLKKTEFEPPVVKIRKMKRVTF